MQLWTCKRKQRARAICRTQRVAVRAKTFPWNLNNKQILQLHLNKLRFKSIQQNLRRHTHTHRLGVNHQINDHHRDNHTRTAAI